jgi:hypothetical protein
MKHAISRKGAALAGTTALVAAAALLPSVAGADSNGHRSGLVIVGDFKTDRSEEAFFDHDANDRPTLGDEIVFTNSSEGPLGAATEYGRCSLHEVSLTAAPAAVTLACTVVIKYGRGSITYQGSARSTLVPEGQSPQLVEPARFAVTGGTGRFVRARGEAVITRFEGTGPNFKTFGRLRVILAP